LEKLEHILLLMATFSVMNETSPQRTHFAITKNDVIFLRRRLCISCFRRFPRSQSKILHFCSKIIYNLSLN